MFNAMSEKVERFLKFLTGLIYFPIFLCAWALHKVARFALAISYFGMLEGRMGKDIIRHLFFGPKH